MRRDVAVVGGGPAGLSAAARLASMGYSVLLLEDDSEIGYPVKCAGIISSDGLSVIAGACGRAPDGVRLESGEVEVLGHGRIELGIGGLGAFAVDRRAIDRCLFDAAASHGVDLRLSERALDVSPGAVTTRRDRYEARAIVDSRGAPAYPRKDRLLSATQYFCRTRGAAREGHVRIIVDKGSSREYFFWEVWTRGGELLVGGAGRSPASVEAMVDSLRARADCAPFRVVRSPIVVGGFAGPGSRGVFRVGDSAGNAKPLTGGGDVLSLVASEMASRAISGYLDGELSLAESHALYGRSWRTRYGREESAQLALRGLYERMDGDDVWDALEKLRDAGALDRINAGFDSLGGWLIASLGVRVLGGMILRRLRAAAGHRDAAPAGAESS
ncbi:MAG: FAD-dependent oxidoreductase [Conexivisphaera sp.]